MTNNEYQCAECYKIYSKVNDNTWNEDLAKEEFKKNFPNAEWNKSTMEVICDDCWQRIKPNYN